MLDFLNTLFQSLAPLWEMSVTAAYAAAVVMILRLLLKKRAPRQVLCLLWLVVFARLLIPVSLESPLSIVPNALPGQEQQIHLPNQSSDAEHPVTPIQPQNPAQNITPNQPANGAVTPVTNNPAVPSLSVPEGVTPAAPQPEAPASFPWQAALAGVWLTGAVLMAAYALFFYLRLRRCLFDAIRAKDGAWEHPAVNSPFILGFVRPRIYLPAGLAGQPRRFILCHERAHLRRLDHIVKPICWVALALHWFNPMVWAAYILMSRDIEAACDEAVIRRLGPQVKADYSATLLALATNGRVPAPCPLAFDEGNAKGRIKNVLRYRRPALWIVVVSVIAAVLAAVCLLTDPVAAKAPDDDPNADPSPDASSSQEPVDFADTLLDPWMKEVLDGERTFRSTYNEERDFTINDLRSFYYGDDQLLDAVVEMGKLAIIDMDRDGVNEMVIYPVGKSADDSEELIFQVGYLILRRVGDEVYGYDPGWRSISRLKADGTFEWDGSAFDGGTGSARFTENGFEINQITWCDNGVDKENYFVDGQKATREEFDAAYDAQRLKPDPAWYTYADGVLAPWLPDNLELVSQTDPVSDTGEAKLWLDGGESPWLEWNGSTHQLNGLVTLAQAPGVNCRDFDGDGENEVVFSYYFNGFLQLDLYEWNGSQPVFTATYDTQQLLLRFNQNNVAAYNKDTRELTVTYSHTEGSMDDPDYSRHLVSGSRTLPEGFFDGGYEHIRDGYPHVYANGFHLSYLKGDANEYYFDFEFYLADETMQELGYVDLGPDSWYADHYMIGKPVGVTGFTLRYDGTQWRVQEADALTMDGSGQSASPLSIPLSDYAANQLPVPDFLDGEQQLIYRQAYALYSELFGAEGGTVFYPALEELEPAEPVERNGRRYIPDEGRFARWENFEQAVLSVFTQNFWDARNSINTFGSPSPDLYINAAGRLYHLEWGHTGGDGSHFPDTFRLVERTDDTISFVMTGYYIDWAQRDGETFEEWEARQNGDWEWYIDFPMRMVKTADGWRFDEFHCAVPDSLVYPFTARKIPNLSPSSIANLAPLSAPLISDYSSNSIPTNPREWYKVAELPDDMIWLYTRNYGGSQILIRWDGNFYKVFNHVAHTPHCVMPRLKKLGGADTYGPLAVISHVDSGTGVDGYELVVYDLDSADAVDYFHDWTALAEDFNQNHTFRFDNDTSTMTLTYRGQTVTKTLTYELSGVTYELLDDHDHDRIEREGCSLYITGEQVHYSFDETTNGNFQLRLGAKFLIGDNLAESLFPIGITWTLRFNGSGFDVVPGSCVVT